MKFGKIPQELRHGEPSQQSWQKDSGQKNFRVRGSGKYFCPSFFCLSNSVAMITAAPSLIPSQRSCGMENLPSSHGKKIQGRKISESEVRENISVPHFFAFQILRA
jgi:hypothetical protein